MNSEAVVQYLVEWLRDQVHDAGAEGLVFGVSGGLDSAVAGAIAQRAFPQNCMALILPCESDISDLMHSQIVVEKFNIPYRIIDLDNAYQLLCTQFESYLKLEGAKGKAIRSNLKPRLRMLALYYSAQARNYLVMGTSNKSELSIGYTTKHGDSGVDLQPFGELLKNEIYELAHYLRVPRVIIEKPPSAGLWFGQTDEAEMGLTYEQLNDYLANKQGEAQVAEKIERMIKNSEHKRRMPPIPAIPR